MISWIVAIVVGIASLGYGALAAMANGMSDAADCEGAPMWPAVVGVALAIGVAVGHLKGVW